MINKIHNATTPLAKEWNHIIDSIDECPHNEVVSKHVNMTSLIYVRIVVCLMCGHTDANGYMKQPIIKE